jgi:hypothetical protein
MARFPKGAEVTRIDVTSAATGNDPCGPLAPTDISASKAA